MRYPRLEIDLDKIWHNTVRMVKLCNCAGIKVAGVTKVFCGLPEIAKVLVDGGIGILADSRIENLEKLKDMNVEKMLLRLPMISQGDKVVEFADISLNSEIETVKCLSKWAREKGKTHKVILMMDLGDLREGYFYKENLFKAVEDIINLKGISLIGLGTNLSCFGGVMPTKDNLVRLIDIKEKICSRYNIQLEVLSGGNSGSLRLLEKGEIPKGINQLRLGASIALGIGLNDERIDGQYYDCFKLVAEIIELKEKSSVPIGEIGLDAFGNKPHFIDRGIRKRAICAIGRQDIETEYLIPKDEDIEIIGASSDHLILDITRCKGHYGLGDKVYFDLTYGGVLRAMTSEYIAKIFKGRSKSN